MFDPSSRKGMKSSPRITPRSFLQAPVPATSPMPWWMVRWASSTGWEPQALMGTAAGSQQGAANLLTFRNDLQDGLSELVHPWLQHPGTTITGSSPTPHRSYRPPNVLQEVAGEQRLNKGQFPIQGSAPQNIFRGCRKEDEKLWHVMHLSGW